MCSGSEAGSYSRLIDSCITQLKAQGPSRTCNESKEEVKKKSRRVLVCVRFWGEYLPAYSSGGSTCLRTRFWGEYLSAYEAWRTK